MVKSKEIKNKTSENSNITKHKETSQFQLQVSQTSKFPSIINLLSSASPPPSHSHFAHRLQEQHDIMYFYEKQNTKTIDVNMNKIYR